MNRLWDHKFLFRIDLRLLLVIVFLMTISLFVISSMTLENSEEGVFFTPFVKSQIQWFLIGWAIFFLCVGFDYRKLREWTWFLYVFCLLLLIGLFFTSPIQNVHRWYRLPLIGIQLQPSEHAKLIVVLTLGWFLERKKGAHIQSLITFFQTMLIVAIPFILILKQPDLGTALVLYPITLIMCYFAGVHKKAFRLIAFLGIILILFTSFMFLGVISHEKMRPVFTKVLKEYQYARLNPDSYHQKASKTAISIGGLTGNGWHKSDFSSRKWLPAAHTDSVFAAFGEEFGFLGMLFLLFLYYSLIYLGFKATAYAKDDYGRLLSSGLTIYLAMHIIMNIAMMLALLPVSGVPLVLVTYGGNSVLTTMAALGILQSIYSRRFMF